MSFQDTVLPRVTYGRTGLSISRISLGGFPFGGVNRSRGWDPFTDEGKTRGIATVHAAIDSGINLVDTAPSYGNGRSEEIVGEALVGRRSDVYLATKVSYSGTPAEVRASVEASLRRLRTDVVDIIQFHGGMYEPADIGRMIDGGLVEELFRLREAGKVRYIGFTVEEPWSGRPLVASGYFDTVQVKYNLIYQSAAHHLLDEAAALNVGVSVMRPMTSGVLQFLAERIAPEWQGAHDIYQAALEFVLSDSRVHLANIGMRSVDEVAMNADFVRGFSPTYDVKDLPRLTAGIYQAQDDLAKDTVKSE
jgi:aryl-alcohol dehydrogenase-like predicted oxidoreductase